MTGANEQALLNAVDAALQPSNPNGLTAFNTSLQGGTALGSDLPVVGTGLSAYNPGTVLGGLLARLGSTTYSSVASLTSALQTGSGITVQSTSDLLNNIELDLQFSATTAISVPLNPNYGVTFVDPGTLTMSTTLTENLTVGAYWDPNISAAVAYVDASNASISVASTATSFTFSPNSTGQLGFLEFDTPTTSVANISGNKLLSTTVSFSPTFTFSLNTQPPVDSAETSGRLTLAQLASVPLASLVNTSVTQPAAATLTVNLSTPLEPSASKIVFTWSDINSPTTVTSTLTSDPTLTVLNQFQAITAGTISGGLDQITGDLTAAATDAAGNTAGFNADLPLIGESINTLVNFAGTSTATAFFTQYLTSFTNPTTSSSGVSTEPFATDEQLLAILAGLPQQSLPTGVTIKSTKSSLTETASGSELIFTLDLDVLIDTEQAISLSPALNLVGLPMLYVQTAVNTQLSFGVLGTTGQFFITASTLPTAQVNVNGTVQDPSYTFPISTTYSGVGTLGYLAVNLTNATFNLAGTAALTITNPNTNNPPTPGIITANELDAGLQSSGTVLPVPANGTVSGTASAVLPMSPYNLTITGVSGATAVLTWSNVSAPSAYTLNTAALTPYIGFNGLSGSALYSALAELPSVLNGASDMSNLGQDLSFFGPNLGPTITLGNLFVTRTGIQASNASNAPATFQTLISALNSDLGFDLTLSSTSDGIQINLPLTQQFSGNVGWQVSEPVTTSAGTRTNFQASGSVPVSGTYTTTLDFGMVLTSSAAAATQFYLLGGSGGSGVTAAFVSNSTSLGASTANLGGNTVNLGGLEAVTGTVTMPLGTSTSAQRLTLSNPLTKPDSLYGKATTVGTATAYFNLSNLPPSGSSGSVTLGWSQVGMPSSISISANGLGSVSNVQSPSSAIQTGLSDLSSFVGEFSQSSTLETTLFLVNQTADQVINYPQDIKTAITQLQTAISTGSTLNTSILGASLGPNVSIAATSNNNPSGGQYEYALTFNFTQPSVANLPFNVQSGLDSNEQSLNITLQTNLAMTASFAGTLTFGYDAGDGFYIYGGSGGNALNLSTQVSTEASFPDDTVGTFGIIPFGVTGGTAGLTASVGLTLNAPGDNGEKISGMDLSADGATLLEPNVTGTGSLMLPFGARLGTGTSAPGVISSFTADWNPMRTQPVEYGASDGTSLLNGFGSVTYDYTEFVDDMLQPVLQQIESYDPIPPQLISALDYQIPIIDETPAQILESEGDYSDSDDLSTILNLLNILNTFPTGGEQLDLSQYLPGAPATGDAGSTDGDNGTSAFSDFQNFVNNLESSTDNVVTLPVFDNVQQSIEQTLLGQPVTLVQLNTGPINYTASTGSITFLPSTPVFDIGIASVNLSITGGASISLTGDLDIGLSNRGLLADGLINSNGTPNTTPNLLDGFFIDDGVGTNFPGLGMQQLALEVNAYVTITGSLDLGGFLSVASISGSLGPYGEVGVRVNSLVPNAQGTGFLTSSSPPYLYEIAGYDGAPQGNGMAYLDEISYIAQNYGPLCAVMPDGQVGLQLNVNGTVGYPPIGFTFNVINQQFPIANFDFPCVPTAGTLAEVEGNELVMLPNILGTGSGENTISAGVLYSPTNQNVPIGIDLVESNQSNIVFQTFTFAQLNGVNTLVMNGDEGNDTYNFDPSLSLTTITGDFGGALVNTANPAPIQYLEINTEDGNDTVKLTNVTPQNSSLLGVTIHGGNGNDF
ncbi:MAG TPA: hypothetical protein VL992_11925, partial [Tepidisphaeraceae bacterium]|nr:hypothetical protein [Tepidisphaeraceae bacterium]